VNVIEACPMLSVMETEFASKHACEDGHLTSWKDKDYLVSTMLPAGKAAMAGPILVYEEKVLVR